MKYNINIQYEVEIDNDQIDLVEVLTVLLSAPSITATTLTLIGITAHKNYPLAGSATPISA